MARRMCAIAAALFAIATLNAAAQGHSNPAPSHALVQTLSTIRRLSDGSFQQLVWWARHPSDPRISVPDWNEAEHEIMQLPRRDREAVLAWLAGHGRQALYARGATNAMIGTRDRPGSSRREGPAHQGSQAFAAYWAWS